MLGDKNKFMAVSNNVRSIRKLYIKSEYELRRDRLLNRLFGRKPETPNALSEEALRGFENSFGEHFGSGHMLAEGWLSYADHLEEKKPDNDTTQISFFMGAMATFRGLTEICDSGVIEDALRRIRSGRFSPDVLWSEFRHSFAEEPSEADLNRCKLAFYSGSWFVSATFLSMSVSTRSGHLFTTGMESLRREINDFAAGMRRGEIKHHERP
jgi:hypothetical protein